MWVHQYDTLSVKEKNRHTMVPKTLRERSKGTGAIDGTTSEVDKVFMQMEVEARFFEGLRAGVKGRTRHTQQA